MVQLALEMTFMSLRYSSLLTPKTKVGVASSLAGAVRMTFLAPPLKWREALSVVLLAPVDSMMYSAPQSAQLIMAASDSLYTLILRPLTIRSPPACSTIPGKFRNTESYFSRYTM